MKCENTLEDRMMCTSSEGYAEIQPHTFGLVQSTLEWTSRDKIANCRNVALFRHKRKKRHEASVRLLLSKKAAKSLLKQDSVSDRISTLRVKLQEGVYCYVPYTLQQIKKSKQGQLLHST